MNLFEVYSLFDLTPVKSQGCYLWDEKGDKYLDLYGGHAVISVGHSHAYYIKAITDQLNKIGFYSNSVHIPIQAHLAVLLGELSGYPDYQFFMCNSGAEANENALKLASFHTNKKKVIAFRHSFHGRTSAAVAATDDVSIVSPLNQTENIVFVGFNDAEALEKAFAKYEVSAVIIEGIQGVGGVRIPTTSFLKKIENLCHQYDALFIVDEIQSGYGRTGKFFAHQFSGVRPHIITVAKGMGNGFPVAGVLISPHIKAKKGMLGTTFGGNYLACAASLAVLEIIQREELIQNAQKMGVYLLDHLRTIPQIKEIRGRGLMVGIELLQPCDEIRRQLLWKHKILTGNAAQKNTLRILPSLSVSEIEINQFIKALKTELNG
ncbi:aminotransferase class III-fold pyridoxal phosphate-dependent enzyme [Elizabethkingia argentiflava]|uniref:Aminotransferase class III-fold pyridoxal phosphate-dependent enzyme n=1 Tax=Elizabethkingia argenteiflava TaxID=2681556 RepID=A0A845PZW0_9FLAO|nr:aminotransferase class III-fold pyridoxal phosphate-dependent enzyme [Elizabethkingia argenteiflava]NAW51977.1 aminotransferase class III-fold pyridoxal phosphate-dependent enzyme [Elizabethkingia argenteiflava]